jgi:hypothetical protein
MNGIWFLIFWFFLLSLFTPGSVLGYSVYTLLGVLFFSKFLQNKYYTCFELSCDLTKGCGFPGEELFICLKLKNRSRFPVFWCTVHQSFPIGLGSIRAKSLVALPPRNEKNIQFHFYGAHRGIYTLPTINLTYGEIIGLKENTLEFKLNKEIVIYPQISNVLGLKLIRHLPLGQQRVPFGLYDDPARLRGCREYLPGDRPKMIHWPNVAKTGNLQTKEWETTLDADIGIFLNLNEEDYPINSWSVLSEDGIELAASITYHLAGDRIGFFSNGKTPNSDLDEDIDLLPNKERGFRLLPKNGSKTGKEILTYLAGVKLDDNPSFESILHEARLLTFGSILIIITPQIQDSIIKEIRRLRNMGYHPLVISPGRFIEKRDGIIRQLEMIGVPVFEGKKGENSGRVFTLSLKN